MKFTALRAAGKWPSETHIGGFRTMVILSLAMLVTGEAKARDDFAATPVRLAPAHHGKMPLPQPRPATAPNDRSSDRDAIPDDAAAAPPSPCRQALTEDIAIAPSIPPIRGPGACGGEDLVRLEAVVLPDKRRVAVKPAAVLRCAMASALADWIRSDVAPLTERLAMRLGELDNFDSFDCRGRNRVATAKLSEHGRANALDLRGLKLADGRLLSLTDRAVAREIREKVRTSVCTRFTTVLGPGSDGYHEDHIHLDLAERRNGYRICQWTIDDAPATEPGTTAVAMPLPAPRPEQAPATGVPHRNTVEQLTVRSASPPAVSLSPVPLAQQPADVAKPTARNVEARRNASGTADAKKSAGGELRAVPGSKSKPRNEGEAKAAGAQTHASKPKPSADGSEPAVADARKPKRRHGKSRARQRPPDLPLLLKRMFD
jgi:hypothetical protein